MRAEAPVTTPIRLDERGIAWLEGTTTKVIEVALAQQASGLEAEQLQQELPHLTLSQVQAALAYYAAHQLELDRQIEERRRWAEGLRSANPNPFTREELVARRNAQD